MSPPVSPPAPHPPARTRTVRVPDDLWTAATIAARITGTTVSAVITAALYDLAYTADPPTPPIYPTVPSTPRSRERTREAVSTLTAQGLTAPEIADRLSISSRTVKRYRARTGVPGLPGPPARARTPGSAAGPLPTTR